MLHDYKTFPNRRVAQQDLRQSKMTALTEQYGNMLTNGMSKELCKFELGRFKQCFAI